MRKRILGFSALLLLTLLAIVPMNTIVLSYENKNIVVQPVFNQKEVSIRWTHSVEKEDWEEFFHIKDNTINLTSTRFKTFGAGVPDNAGEDTYIKDGWVYMTNIHQPIGTSLRFQTGKNTNHRISLNARTLVLDSQRSYQLSVGSVPMYELIYMIVKD
ncbi:DUF1850 domain-containing protein [Rossellomorea yichunensis]|jgi:hypothetical protein|uniref:DUF1850 domain-containing protein n=1 Tax=Rossellomorea yichunensis TaxID=3077331 RepID=UPI0028DECE2B|nr:DUF1850 domain-containing protein [Rossellomorea sp. YC4-1]MDT9026485.1 DUF1850 domain-containing protein [Rossellomorea sp. YC4-1]